MVGAPEGRRNRLLWEGLALAALAVGFELLWLARSPMPDGGMAFEIRRLGLRLAPPRVAYEAFAAIAAAATTALAVRAFLAARRAFRGHQAGEGATPSPIGRQAVALALFLLFALPFFMAVCWVDGRVNYMVFYGAEWFRRLLFKELGLVVTARMLWLGALLSLGAWLARRPPARWSGAVADALAAVARLPRWAVVGACALALCGMAVAFSLGAQRGEPFFVDAVQYFFQAKLFAAGRVWAPLPFSADFLDPRQCPHPMSLGMIFLEDRWFIVGLPTAPLLYALGILAGVPWLVSPLLGAGAVVLAYVLTRDVFGEAAGLVALPLTALSGWLVFNAGEYLTHLPCMVAMQGFFIGAVRAMRGGSWGWAATAGLALGVAANARPATALALCLPFAVAWLVWLLRSPRFAWRATLAFALGLALPLAGMLAYNAAITGNPLRFGYDYLFRMPELKSGYGMEFVPGWRWRPVVGVAFILGEMYKFGAAIYRWPIPSVGTLLAAAHLLGVWRGPDGRRWPLLLGLAALSLAVAYARFPDLSEGLGGPRYVFEALPCIIAIGAGAVVALHRRLAGAGVAHARAAAVIALGLAFCFAYSTAVVVGTDVPRFPPPQRADLRVFDAVEASAQRPAVVFMPVPPGNRFTRRLVAAVARNSPTMDGPILYVRDLGERNREVAAKYPGRHLYRWSDERGALLPLEEATP